MKEAEIRKTVRENYGRIAVEDSARTTGAVPDENRDFNSQAKGYSEEELKSVPDGADLGLGCGNPTALASLKEGETVLDLGSGGGFDCFLASEKVGESGRVIGVDMTAEMVEKARENAARGGYSNVEFRLGEIENLPVADSSVDLIISNCVINLSTNKKRVFEEAFRVLKPGGRMIISDMTLTRELPEAIRDSVAAYIGCVSGAMTREQYLDMVARTGFDGGEIVHETPIRAMFSQADVDQFMKDTGVSAAVVDEFDDAIISLQIKASKPE